MSTSLLFVAALALTGPNGPAKSNAPAPRVVVSNCFLSIINEAQVPGREAGDLVALDVQEGDQVKMGQILAQIDDEVAQKKKEIASLDFQAANEQATNKIRIEAAVAGEEVAKAEFQKSLETNRRQPNTISQSQLRKEELSHKHAKLQSELARHEFKVAGMTASGKKAQEQASDVEIEHRKIVAPLDGVVVQLSKHKGEWVNPGDPVLRIVYLKTLRVEGFLKAEEYTPSEVDGRPVTVTVKLANGREEKLEGKLKHTPIVEGHGYRIWTEVKNPLQDGRFVLLPGMPAEMSISLDRPAAPVDAVKVKTTSNK